MTNKPDKILIIDDDYDILELLEYNLNKEGYITETANSGIKALEIVKNFIPDIIIVDIMMPGMDGVETCRKLREIPELSTSHIVFLTARAEEYSEIAAFDSGGDDYIIKPIKPRALISRLSAISRKKKEKVIKDENIFKIGKLEINRTSYTVSIDGNIVVLPKKEFELLHFLAANPSKVYTRDDLLHNIWGTDVYVLARTVDVHVRKIREKIGEGFIKTVKGVGYKLELDD